MSQNRDNVNPRVSNPDAATLSNLSIYDLARWKPLSADRFIEEMVVMTQDLQEELVVTTEYLADGRVRIAYHAEVRERGINGKISDQPYMITISDPSDNRSRPMAMVRTDVDLNLGDDQGNV